MAIILFSAINGGQPAAGTLLYYYLRFYWADETITLLFLVNISGGILMRPKAAAVKAAQELKFKSSATH